MPPIDTTDQPPAPGRRPPGRRLLPGACRDGQRRPHQPPGPEAGPEISCGPATPWASGNSPRLGRSLRHLVDTITSLADRDIGFGSLQAAIDTTTPDGTLVFPVVAALAHFDPDLIRERTTAGPAAARARGRHGGRPSALTTHKARVAQELYASGPYSVAAIATTLGVPGTGLGLLPAGSRRRLTTRRSASVANCHLERPVSGSLAR